MKVFIVQPQGGKTAEELRTDSEAARVALQDFYSGDEFEVLEIPQRREGELPMEFLGRSLAEMARADCVAYREGCEDDVICLCMNFCGAMMGKESRFI